jgi:hypothetical protein
MFVIMLIHYDHDTCIIQVNAIHRTASEHSKLQVDHMSPFIRQQQIQAVQHNRHDKQRHSVVWLNTGNSRHMIHHTEPISCQSGPRCNYNGTAWSLHLSSTFPLCTNNQYINTLCVYRPTHLYFHRCYFATKCKITHPHAEASKWPRCVAKTCSKITSVEI